jgi:hypothetical protein
MRHIRTQRACAWCGVVFIALLFLGFCAVAGFIPPPRPSDSARQIAEMFDHNRTSIRIGLLITTFASSLLVPWTVGIFMQLRRTEGSYPVLSYVQFGSGTLTSLEFIYLLFLWITAAFRANRAPSDVQLLNDMAWLPMVGLVSTFIVQAAAIGLAILLDGRERTVYPRWGGYLNLWCAVMFLPGSLCVFFLKGPFSWNGIVSFWMLIAAFTIWMLSNSWLLLDAVRRQEVDERGASGALSGNDSSPEQLAALEREVESLRARLTIVESY